MLNKDLRLEIEKEVQDFKACCRYFKITDKQLFDKYFPTIEWKFKTFQTMLDRNPCTIVYKFPENYKNMKRLHKILIKRILKSSERYL